MGAKKEKNVMQDIDWFKRKKVIQKEKEEKVSMKKKRNKEKTKEKEQRLKNRIEYSGSKRKE